MNYTRNLFFAFSVLSLSILHITTANAASRKNRRQCATPSNQALSFYDSIDQIHPSHDPEKSFVEINEFNILDSRPILSQSNGGLYIGVGSERVNLGALISNADSILVIDNDPAILWFHSINYSLIRIAKNQGDYVHLRVKAKHSEWVQRVKESKNQLGEREQKLLLASATWSWWEANVRKSSLKYMHQNRLPKDENAKDWIQIRSLNYLFDSSLYGRLKKLVDNRKVDVMWQDLRPKSERWDDARDKHVNALEQELHQDITHWFQCHRRQGHSTKIGVFDISNVATPGPVKFSRQDGGFLSLGIFSPLFSVTAALAPMTQIFEVFQKHAQPNSLFMFTTIKAIPQSSWSYHGYSFSELTKDQATRYKGLKTWLLEAWDCLTPIEKNFSFNKFGSELYSPYSSTPIQNSHP